MGFLKLQGAGTLTVQGNGGLLLQDLGVTAVVVPSQPLFGRFFRKKRPRTVVKPETPITVIYTEPYIVAILEADE